MNKMRQLTILILLIAVPHATAQTLGEYWNTAEQENEYYRIVDVPVPEEIELEASSFEVMPDGRLAIGTRRGDIHLVEGAFEVTNRNMQLHR